MNAPFRAAPAARADVRARRASKHADVGPVIVPDLVGGET